MTGWRISSYSHNGQSCVEVGHGPGAVGVRDSTDPDGPVLTFSGSTWGAWMAALKAAH